VVAGIAQSVKRLSAGWTVWGSNPSRGEIFRSVQTGPEDHPVSRTVRTGCSQEVKQSELGADHQLLSSAEISNVLALCLCLPSVSARACRGVTCVIIILMFNLHFISIPHPSQFQSTLCNH
jgi:hypothetical protein